MVKKISYAQYGEDIILSVLLEKVKKGFYVDVGANYETEDSVTKYFYQHGWTGLNIEPVRSLYDVLAQKRKKDINLNIGISSSGGPLRFREYAVHGHSTFSADIMQGEEGEMPFRDYEVKTKPLSEVLKEYGVGIINFLKIDVEGFEYEVVKSNDWSLYRPQVLCIEANHTGNDWRPIVTGAGYSLFIKDGLNEYYVADEVRGLLIENYAERAVKATAEFMRKHHSDQFDKIIKAKERQQNYINYLKAEVSCLKQENEKLRETSYMGLPLRNRVALAGRSVMSDWPKLKLLQIRSKRKE